MPDQSIRISKYATSTYYGGEKQKHLNIKHKKLIEHNDTTKFHYSVILHHHRRQ